MDVLRDTSFEVGWLTWQLRPPRPSLTVVVKGTFALVPGGDCVPVEEQPLVAGDQHQDDDDTRSVRVESDLAVLKPRGECLLAGTCHPPSGRATISAVSMRVGSPGAPKARSVDKSVAVLGDRNWRGSWLGGPPAPAPFESMPLTWERSFGGARSDENPVGRGLDKDPTGHVALPNIEDPKELVMERGTRPRPAGLGPIARTWKPRTALTGTYDAGWHRTRWPWFPVDFDCAYFNAAPLDQRIDGYWRGDETITLRNLSREHPLLETRLPGVVARAFLARATAASSDARPPLPSRGEGRGEGTTLEEIPMRLDTIAIDSDAGTVTCLWRGLVEVAREDLSDVAHLFVAHEALGESRSIESHAGRLAELLAMEAAEAFDALGENPPENPGETLDPQTAAEHRAVLASALSASPDLQAFVDARLAAGESMSSLDLTAIDLAGRVLDGCDLSGSILAQANLRGASLRSAVLDGAVLDGANLDGANLEGASLLGCSLVGARARGAKLDGARLDGAQVEDGDFDHASLRGASLRFAIFEGANLAHVDFQGACLDEAELGSSRLENAVFLDASLIDASLLSVEAAHAVFDRATITGIRAGDGAKLRGASFRRCQGARASFRGATLDQADFFSSDLESADLAGASLVATNFDGCVLRSARFERAKLIGAHARGADLFEACFEDADLSHADMRGANLFGAETWHAKIDGIHLETALIGRTKLESR